MRVPASYHQERLWFIDRFEAGNLYESSPVYHNIPLIFEIKGDLDVPLLEKSLMQVIRRHEALRTRVIAGDINPVQFVEPEVNITLDFLDLSRARGNGTYEEALDLALADSRRPFILDKGPLIRGKLFQLKEQDFILVITLHHLAADKYSLEIISREMFLFYQSGLEGKEPVLAELSIHYADFSRSQRELPPRLLKTLLLYWKAQLRGKIQALELPTDRPRALVHRFREARHTFVFPGRFNQKIRDFANRKNIDIFIDWYSSFS